MTAMHIELCETPESKAAAGRFLGMTIRNDTSYISHGELQQGLAVSPDRWIDSLEDALGSDFGAYDDSRIVLAAFQASGDMVGVLAMHIAQGGKTCFATIEDMAVDPGARGGGVGRALVADAAERARQRGAANLFLESGVGNSGAHTFFERQGFAPVSKVFRLSLDDPHN
jgi:GNAT superfamily N-acetyltransferase